MIQIRRVYDAPQTTDGTRVLVDRLWPRGLTKQKAKVDWWLREIAPSEALRKWFGHDPKKWSEFQTRYRKELKSKSKLLSDLKAKSAKESVTLLYGAKDERHNQAVVLQKLLH